MVSILQGIGMGIIKIVLATALISLTLTQTAILSFALPGQDMSVYNGICGMLFGAVAAVIGVIIVREGRR